MPLRLAIQHNVSDDAVLAIIESYPGLSRGTKCTARLPLDNAILFGASTFTTLDLIHNYPVAATMSDDSNIDGELPINLALQHGRSFEVIVALLIAHPESLESCRTVNMKKLHPNILVALSRPQDYWEAKRMSMLSDVMSELRAEAISIPGAASNISLLNQHMY